MTVINTYEYVFSSTLKQNIIANTTYKKYLKGEENIDNNF